MITGKTFTSPNAKTKDEEPSDFFVCTSQNKLMKITKVNTLLKQ